MPQYVDQTCGDIEGYSTGASPIVEDDDRAGAHEAANATHHIVGPGARVEIARKEIPHHCMPAKVSDGALHDRPEVTIRRPVQEGRRGLQFVECGGAAPDVLGYPMSTTAPGVEVGVAVKCYQVPGSRHSPRDVSVSLYHATAHEERRPAIAVGEERGDGGGHVSGWAVVVGEENAPIV